MKYLYGYMEDNDWAKPVMNDGQGWREVKDSFLTVSYNNIVSIAVKQEL